MSYTRQLEYEVLRSLNTATATTFQAIGTPLLHPASIVKVVNLSDKDLLISVDGTNNHDICPANGYFLYDVTSDSPTESGSVFRKKGTQYYAKTTDAAAGTGLVYLVVQYVVQQ